ncbi:MAG TPA: hypothetical protein VH560_06410 [Polyangia bacterium]|nr:hypothetical protein [Polyangia bacterium]
MTTQGVLVLLAVVGAAICGCGKLKPHDVVDAAITEAAAADARADLQRDLEPDVATESAPDGVLKSPPDVVAASPADAGDAALDFDGGVACGPMTCGSGEFCVQGIPGSDAGTAVIFECDPVSGCDGGVPACTCVAGFILPSSKVGGICGMTCHQVDDRHLQCNGA